MNRCSAHSYFLHRVEHLGPLSRLLGGEDVEVSNVETAETLNEVEQESI